MNCKWQHRTGTNDTISLPPGVWSPRVTSVVVSVAANLAKQIGYDINAVVNKSLRYERFFVVKCVWWPFLFMTFFFVILAPSSCKHVGFL